MGDREEREDLKHTIGLLAEAIERTAISLLVDESANLVDGLFAIARALNRVAQAIDEHGARRK